MAAAETFRRAGTADADAVTELTRAAYAKGVPVSGREPLPRRAEGGVSSRWVQFLKSGA